MFDWVINNGCFKNVRENTALPYFTWQLVPSAEEGTYPNEASLLVFFIHSVTLYSFPVAAVTNHHKHSSLQFCGSDVPWESHQVEVDLLEGRCSFLQALGEDPFPCSYRSLGEFSPCSCKTEISFSFLAISWGPLAASFLGSWPLSSTFKGSHCESLSHFESFPLLPSHLSLWPSQVRLGPPG